MNGLQKQRYFVPEEQNAVAVKRLERTYVQI